MRQITPISDPFKDPQDGRLMIDIRVSVDGIIFLKYAAESYKGDKDDKKMEGIRDDIHEIFKIMRPS